jgi:hypothetical protein
MAWAPAAPRRESLGSVLPQYSGGSGPTSPVGSPRSDAEGSDTDTDALVDAIQRAKAAESASIGKRKRSLSLSRTKHKRSLSSSERPEALGLPPASFERNEDGSPRVTAAVPLLASHKLASTGGITNAPMPAPPPLPEALKKSKKNKTGGGSVSPPNNVETSQDAQLATLVAQTKAIQEQLKRMSANMDTLYTVSTKQLERIYNQVDELGRTGRITHADDHLQLIDGDGRDKSKGGGCCCLQ